MVEALRLVTVEGEMRMREFSAQVEKPPSAARCSAGCGGLGVRPAEHRTSPAPGTDLVPGWKPLRSRAQRQQRGWVALCSGDSVLGQYGPERRAVPCH